jgi:hypothetical protein
MTTDYNLNNILKRLKDEEKIIPFIGAGLSSHLKLPTSKDLIKILANEMTDYDPEIFEIYGEFSQLVEYCAEGTVKIGHVGNLLSNKFNVDDNKIKKSSAHQALAKCNFPLIYTTNFDNIIERSIEIENNEKPYVVRTLNDLVKISKNTKTIIIKFHGDFNDDSSLVITEESYFNRLSFESPLDIRLRSDILGKTLLFIGYSFKDINIRYMIYKLNKLRREEKLENDQPIAIITLFDSNDIIKNLFKRRNVEIVELNPIDKIKSLTQFLGNLI